MKLITKNTDYAVRVLCKITEHREFVSTRIISEETKVPLAFLRAILSRLIKEKILEAREGKSGGVRLKKNPSSIKLTEIIKLFQGEIQISQCILRKKVCPDKSKCQLRKKLKDIEKFISKELEKITIQSLS
ncbi:MAG: Rrf2 family transcriptional regulator [Candidatus Omnitrophica bacterium]|nr:Rrf2 family transcriptional regulator [Candidatus Omnitrophota bacterium]